MLYWYAFATHFLIYGVSYTLNGLRHSRYLTMEIAPFKKARSQNVPGNLFVDESCIDCDVCRWMCPSVFSRKGIKSAVTKQPIDEDEKIRSYAAMVSCPVGSIRTYSADPLVKQALDVFPTEIDPVNIPGIMHLGYHSVGSYGATPYMVRRIAGNIMIDTPRFNERLARSIESMGSLQYIILTHKDDVADHEKWKARFPHVQRVIHRTDAIASDGTTKCEVLLEGGGTWSPDSDYDIIHTPGHTAGSLSIQVNTGREVVLFTGDTLAYSASRGALEGFKRYNHGNMHVQTLTIERLAEDKYPFTWILPGHGRMVRFDSLAKKRQAVLEAAEKFETEDESDGIFAVGYY